MFAMVSRWHSPRHRAASLQVGIGAVAAGAVPWLGFSSRRAARSNSAKPESSASNSRSELRSLSRNRRSAYGMRQPVVESHIASSGGPDPCRFETRKERLRPIAARVAGVHERPRRGVGQGFAILLDSLRAAAPGNRCRCVCSWISKSSAALATSAGDINCRLFCRMSWSRSTSSPEATHARAHLSVSHLIAALQSQSAPRERQPFAPEERATSLPPTRSQAPPDPEAKRCCAESNIAAPIGRRGHLVLNSRWSIQGRFQACLRSGRQSGASMSLPG